MTTKNRHAVLGSELAMVEACRKLSNSIDHGSACAPYGQQGRDLAKEVEKHIAHIQAALANWREALDHYEEMHK